MIDSNLTTNYEVLLAIYRALNGIDVTTTIDDSTIKGICNKLDITAEKLTELVEKIQLEDSKQEVINNYFNILIKIEQNIEPPKKPIRIIKPITKPIPIIKDNEHNQHNLIIHRPDCNTGNTPIKTNLHTSCWDPNCKYCAVTYGLHQKKR